MKFFTSKTDDVYSFARILCVVLGLSIGINMIIFAFGFEQTSSTVEGLISRAFVPPWFVGSVWVFLLCCMSYAYWITKYRICNPLGTKLIVWLFLVCILYPLYTVGFESKYIGLMANFVTIVFSGFIAGILYNATKLGAFLIFLTTLWVSFVTFVLYSPKF